MMLTCLSCQQTKRHTVFPGYARSEAGVTCRRCFVAATPRSTEGRCSQCGVNKPITDFGMRNNRVSGRTSACLACLGQYSRRCSPVAGSYSPEYHRRRNLRRLYGITPEQFDAILCEQGGVCASCGGPPFGKAGKYHVDHCHATGRIRGLLCHKCNVALGMASDNVDYLNKLITYLVGHDSSVTRTFPTAVNPIAVTIPV